MSDVFVVIPVYNEAACIGAVCDEVFAFAAQHRDYRFLFVNDGSTDDTAPRLTARLDRERPERVELMSLPANSGKGAAVRAGMQRNTGRLVCFLDGDLAYSLDHLSALVEALGHADIAIGNRLAHAGNVGRVASRRRLASRGYNCLVRWLTGLPYADTQAGLKGLRAAAAEAVLSRQTLSHFAFDVEMLYIARKQKLTVAEVPAKVSADHAGKGSTVRLFRDSLRMVWALCRIRYRDVTGHYG